MDCDLRIVRPLNDVKNDNINYYQIIRNHIKPERPPPKKAVKRSMREEVSAPKILGRPQKTVKEPKLPTPTLVEEIVRSEPSAF